jgi:hypothetical protein
MPFEDLLVIILISPGLSFALDFLTSEREITAIRTGTRRNWRSGSWKMPMR